MVFPRRRNSKINIKNNNNHNNTNTNNNTTTTTTIVSRFTRRSEIETGIFDLMDSGHDNKKIHYDDDNDDDADREKNRITPTKTSTTSTSFTPKRMSTTTTTTNNNNNDIIQQQRRCVAVVDDDDEDDNGKEEGRHKKKKMSKQSRSSKQQQHQQQQQRDLASSKTTTVSRSSRKISTAMTGSTDFCDILKSPTPRKSSNDDNMNHPKSPKRKTASNNNNNNNIRGSRNSSERNQNNGGSSGGVTTNSTSSGNTKNQILLSKGDHRSIKNRKMLIILCLIGIGTIVTGIIFVLISSASEMTSKQSYIIDAMIIQAAIESAVGKMFESQLIMARTITTERNFKLSHYNEQNMFVDEDVEEEEENHDTNDENLTDVNHGNVTTNNENHDTDHHTFEIPTELDDHTYFSWNTFEGTGYEARKLGRLQSITYAPRIKYNHIDSYLQFIETYGTEYIKNAQEMDHILQNNNNNNNNKPNHKTNSMMNPQQQRRAQKTKTKHRKLSSTIDISTGTTTVQTIVDEMFNQIYRFDVARDIANHVTLIPMDFNNYSTTFNNNTIHNHDDDDDSNSTTTGTSFLDDYILPTLYISPPPPFFTATTNNHYNDTMMSNVTQQTLTDHWNLNDDVHEEPRTTSSFLNIDLLSDRQLNKLINLAIQIKGTVTSNLFIDAIPYTDFVTGTIENEMIDGTVTLSSPKSIVVQPVYDELQRYFMAKAPTTYEINKFKDSISFIPEDTDEHHDDEVHEDEEHEEEEEDHNKAEHVIGLTFAVIEWEQYFQSLLTENINGIQLIMKSSCDEEVYTYEIMEGSARYVGEGDLHSGTYRMWQYSFPLIEPLDTPTYGESFCSFSIDLYPTKVFLNSYKDNTALFLAIGIAINFLFMIMTFVLYDKMARERESKLARAASVSLGIVTSLFPKSVRDRLMSENISGECEKGTSNTGQKKKPKSIMNMLQSQRGQFHDSGNTNNHDSNNGNNGGISDDNSYNFSKLSLNEVDESAIFYKTKPIADLFPSATIFYGDLVGFTSWSSIRDPTDVFTMLETVYHTFDLIAQKRNVFKVETIGDCYVAVCGLPEKRDDHAVCMARFARECMLRMWKTAKQLAIRFGPDTADLTMRMGLHSGPVTAGVLRGQKSRFQLFGDTMNIAAKMENTSQSDCIQLSEETASLLRQAGKTKWIQQREENNIASNTYWLSLYDAIVVEETSNSQREKKIEEASLGRQSQHASVRSLSSANDSQQLLLQEFLSCNNNNDSTSKNLAPIVTWYCNLLTRVMQELSVYRVVMGNNDVDAPQQTEQFQSQTNAIHLRGMHDYLLDQGSSQRTISQQTIDVIEFPESKRLITIEEEAVTTTIIEPFIINELKDYVTTIAALYRTDGFYTLEKASHCTMAMQQFLSHAHNAKIKYGSDNSAFKVQKHRTCGVSFDPLTKFGLLLSTLIMDVDHPGVTNSQLAKEEVSIAAVYRYQCIAEQNSFDIAFQLFMEDKYAKLRTFLFPTVPEFQLFRQVVINAVMASDLTDKVQHERRNQRWNIAFSPQMDASTNSHHGHQQDSINHKTSVILEYLIQASLLAPAYQHWNLYRKWSEVEYGSYDQAYQTKRGLNEFCLGSTTTDPATYWYEKQMYQFEHNIIPAIKKLLSSGAFDHGLLSASSTNAIRNKKEWTDRGRDIVIQFVNNLRNDISDIESAEGNINLMEQDKELMEEDIETRIAIAYDCSSESSEDENERPQYMTTVAKLVADNAVSKNCSGDENNSSKNGYNISNNKVELSTSATDTGVSFAAGTSRLHSNYRQQGMMTTTTTTATASATNVNAIDVVKTKDPTTSTTICSCENDNSNEICQEEPMQEKKPLYFI